MKRINLAIGVILALPALGSCSPKPRVATSTATAEMKLATNPLSCASSWAKGFQSDRCEMADSNFPPPIVPIFWPDACTPTTGAGWSPSQTSFDQLSWRNFLYLVWPADSSKPGTPDTRQPIGARQGCTFLPTVWESFKSPEDLFSSGGTVPAGCSAGGPRILTMTSKVPEATFHAVAGAGLLDSIDQAFSGPLVDQNRNLVYYEVRINEIEHDAIVNAGAQKKSPAELNCTRYNPRGCSRFEFPLGSMEIKAAWKQLSADEARSGRFYSQLFQIEKPDGQCPTVTMGLVGLHIIHKTQLSAQGHPSWTWSTFEHADNVPPRGPGGQSSRPYSFSNPSCFPQVSAARCAQAANAHDPSAPEYRCCENLDRYGPGAPPVDPTPHQITRLDDPPQETADCNTVYANTQRGIWDNYSLVATQWPKSKHPLLRGKEGGDGEGYAATPPHLRNTVIESYFARWDETQRKQVSTSNCMGCHSGSQAVDMSYLFLGNASK